MTYKYSTYIYVAYLYTYQSESSKRYQIFNVTRNSKMYFFFKCVTNININFFWLPRVFIFLLIFLSSLSSILSFVLYKFDIRFIFIFFIIFGSYTHHIIVSFFFFNYTKIIEIIVVMCAPMLFHFFYIKEICSKCTNILKKGSKS